MSTILKALQKVEPESFGSGARPLDSSSKGVAHQNAGQADPENIDSSLDKADRLSASEAAGYGVGLRKNARPIFFLMLAVLVVVGLWLFFKPSGSISEKQVVKTFPITKESKRQPISKPPESTGETLSSTQAAKTQKPVDVPSTEPVGSSDSAASSVSSKKVVKKSKQSMGTQSGGVGSAQGDDNPMEPLQKAPTSGGAVTQTADTLGAAADDAAVSREQPAADEPVSGDRKSLKANVKKQGDSSQPTPENETIEKAARWKSAKQIKNDSMILQALAWSREPTKRMGVIDGLVVREGDEANGFTVVAIQKRNMILSRDGQYFRLEFKRK